VLPSVETRSPERSDWKVHSNSEASHEVMELRNYGQQSRKDMDEITAEKSACILHDYNLRVLQKDPTKQFNILVKFICLDASSPASSQVLQRVHQDTALLIKSMHPSLPQDRPKLWPRVSNFTRKQLPARYCFTLHCAGASVNI
jgi:hypothetical protein